MNYKCGLGSEYRRVKILFSQKPYVRNGLYHMTRNKQTGSINFKII
nr:MAG TPA: hypothetical protein [Caudoviricetes sp.]